MKATQKSVSGVVRPSYKSLGAKMHTRKTTKRLEDEGLLVKEIGPAWEGKRGSAQSSQGSHHTPRVTGGGPVRRPLNRPKWPFVRPIAGLVATRGDMLRCRIHWGGDEHRSEGR